MIRKASTQHPDFTGARNVDQVGTKAVENFPDDGDVPWKSRIEAQIPFESEGEDPSRQLKRPDIPLFDEGF